MNQSSKDVSSVVSIFDPKDISKIAAAIDRIGPLTSFTTSTLSSSASSSATFSASSSSSALLSAVHQQPVLPSKRGLTCRLCQLTFESSADQQAHFKSEAHVAKLTGKAGISAAQEGENDSSGSDCRWVEELGLSLIK
jgi:hypothetical protein